MKNIINVLQIDKDTAVLITSPHNMQYFSGFSGGEGYVLICENNKYILIDSRYTGIAKEEAHENFNIIEYNITKPLSRLLLDLLDKNEINKILFEEDFMTVSTYNKLLDILKNYEFIPYSNEINQLRMIKSNSEIESIRHAEQIGVDAFNHIIKYIKIGITENEIAAELEYFMKKCGSENTSFDTIVLSGKRTALPHGMPSDKKIENGDFVLMDYGCKYHGYCSDMTRTVVVGKADEKQREIYNIVKQAQEVGENSIRSGIFGSIPDRLARMVIEESGYGEYFGHSLGHGVGLLIHELPNLSPKSNIILKENMIVSCEPGIYIYGQYGVRIEDLICVKEDGCENLTKLTKDLIELG